MHGTLAMALLGRALALAVVLGSIGDLAVLGVLSLEFHLALLNSLGLGSLLHGSLLSLLAVHAGPQTTNIAGWLLVATNAVRVDKVGSVIAGEEHGRHGCRAVEVHGHIGIEINARVPAETRAEVRLANAGVEAVVLWHVGHAAYREANLLFELSIVVARAIELLTLLVIKG